MSNHSSDGDYGHHEESTRTVELRESLPGEERCEKMAAFASAFADAHRIRVLSLLARGPVCVGEIAVILQRSQSAVSHQLKLLKSLGLVRSTRKGRHIYYSIVIEHEREILSTLEEATQLTGGTP